MNWIRIILIFAVVGIQSHAAEYVAAPKWQVTVVNDKGEAMAKAEVEQTWSYYFGAGHVEGRTNLLTDAKGQILFPQRKVFNPSGVALGQRMLGALNVHSSYGPSSSVYVSADGFDRASVWHDPKLPLSNGVLHSRIVLKRVGRPAGLTQAVLASDLAQFRAELKNDPYYAQHMHGVKLLNDVVRSPKVDEATGIEMIKLVMDQFGTNFLERPDLAAQAKAYAQGISPTHTYVDFRDNDKITALCRAIMLRKFCAAEYLLSIGALPNPEPGWQTPDMPSALHLGVKSGNVEIIKALLAKRAKLDAKDADGKTPLDWAKRDGNQEIIRLLEIAK